MTNNYQVVTLTDLSPAPQGKKGWPWTEQSHSVEAICDGSVWPRISIVTPSFNQGQFLEKTIRSVLLQGYPNIEYIIIDGGSTDESIEIIKKYEPWISNWVSEKDSGQSNAINKGFGKATGQIYAWLNSDDIYLPNALTSIGKSFMEEDNIGAVVGLGRKLNEQGKVIYVPERPKLDFQSLANEWGPKIIWQPSCFFSNQAWKQCGPLDEDLYFCMDMDLWLKIAQNFKLKELDQFLSHAISHRAAKTTGSREYMAVEHALVLLKRYNVQKSALYYLKGLADSAIESKQKITALTQNPIYKLLGPIYRALRKLRKNINESSPLAQSSNQLPLYFRKQLK